MFLDIFELSIENKKLSLGKTVLIIWSQICEKNGLMCPINGFEKKVRFQVFKIYVFLLFCTFFSN